MGEALDQAKRKLGLDNPGGAPAGDKKEPTLEEIIATVRDLESRELLEAKARQMRAEFDARTRELEARFTKGGTKVNGKDSENAERWSVVGGKPVKDPDGEYESFGQAYKVADLEARATAVAAAEKNNPLAFFEFLQKQGLLGGKTDTFQGDLAKRYLDNIDNQLKAALESKGKPDTTIQELRGELASVREEARRAGDPIELMTRAKLLTESMREAGIIAEPGAPGESIETLKEKHRHAEKLEELKTDRDYKTGMVDAVGNLAEDIGAGAASQVLGRKEVPPDKTGGGVLETVQCSGCHATIYVTPETDKVTCTKCGIVSERPKA